ncbi:MAG: hypothetical protein IAF58_12615 [Leptolyngbya sp.]|nr:hypothetical protein [Candidatus Melainabacteria bacterium]
MFKNGQKTSINRAPATASILVALLLANSLCLSILPSTAQVNKLQPEAPDAVAPVSPHPLTSTPASNKTVPPKTPSKTAPYTPPATNVSPAKPSTPVAPALQSLTPKAATPAAPIPPPPSGATSATPGNTGASSPSTSTGPAPAPDRRTGLPASAPPATTPPATTPSASAVMPADPYPAVARLEVLTFGDSRPTKPIADRLADIETTVFKLTHPTDSLFVRTERLQKILVGSDDPASQDKPNYRPADLPSYARVPPSSPPPAGNSEWTDDIRRAAPTGNPEEGKYAYFDEIASLPENRAVVTTQQLQDYFVEMVNNERSKVGAGPLEVDAIAEKMALEHATNLAQRSQISHANVKGDNPDRRYSLLGGVDAVNESLVSVKSQELGSKKLIKGAAARLLRVLMSHQDDRDALTSLDATHIGFSADWTADHSRLIACAEIVSRHAVIHPVPLEATIDDKIEVKGVLMQPYNFVRVTLAWEGKNNNLANVADESDEALPYFPPLDYIAYQRRSEGGGHDKAILFLKGVGIAAAIAGGVFMPPVALAAPMIAVAGTPSEHKPASEIPVKGGVKLEGSVFEAKVPLSNEKKDGLYYLTVWAENPEKKVVPISRRVLNITGKEDAAQPLTDSDTGQTSNPPSAKKDSKSEKKQKKSKNDKASN